MKEEYLPDNFSVGETGVGGARFGNKIFCEKGHYYKDVIAKWKKAFLDIEDTTEYKFALEVVGDWEEYQKIKNNSKILRQELLPKWHAELEVKLRSEAIATMITDATSPESKSAPSSAKWLEAKLSSLDKDRAKEDKEQAKDRDEGTLDNVTKLYDKIKSK